MSLNLDFKYETTFLGEKEIVKWYYLFPNGTMAVNTTIDGYYINKQAYL